MTQQFSNQLICKLIALFQKEHGIVLTPETADEYLDSYAELFLSFRDNQYSDAVVGNVPRPKLRLSTARPWDMARSTQVKRRPTTATDLINSTLNENA